VAVLVRLRARKADEGGVDADAGESDEGILCDAIRVPDWVESVVAWRV
jgi:hypothetical protein